MQGKKCNHKFKPIKVLAQVVARNLVVIVVGANQVMNPPPLCLKEK